MTGGGATTATAPAGVSNSQRLAKVEWELLRLHARIGSLEDRVGAIEAGGTQSGPLERPTQPGMNADDLAPATGDAAPVRGSDAIPLDPARPRDPVAPLLTGKFLVFLRPSLPLAGRGLG